jgi:hypothetical protein
MIPKKAIIELQKNINPYLPFMQSWSEHEDCSLTSDDLNIITKYSNNDFKVNFIRQFFSYNQTEKIKTVIAKLIWDYQKFKVWIITNFVFSLVKIARDNNFNDLFYHLPLDYTSIPNKVKNNLKLFKVETFYQFFEKYNEHDLYKETVFKNILLFEVTLKNINQ